jgi:phage gp36-like protein
MAYCDLQGLLERYGEAEVLGYADPHSTGEADAALVERLAADVDAEIDTHLDGRYPLPLTETPRVVTRIAADLLRERLMLAAGARLDSDAPERRSAEDARRLLRELSAGRLSIGLPTPAARGTQVQMIGEPLLWRRGTSGGYL